MKQEQIEAERQWWEGTQRKWYCLDFALFCPRRNIDLECDGDTCHSSPDAAVYDIARDNFGESERAGNTCSVSRRPP